MKSLIEFIMELEFMTTKEFCTKFKVPVPCLTKGVGDFHRIDAVKLKMINDHCKVLLKNSIIVQHIGGGKIVFYEKALFIDWVVGLSKFAISRNADIESAKNYITKHSDEWKLI